MVKQIAKDINELSTERLLDIVVEAWSLLEAGGVIISQLDVSYGFMGVTPKAVKKINELKKRNRYKYTSVFGTSSLALRLLKCSRKDIYLAEALQDTGYPAAFTGTINYNNSLIKNLSKEMYRYLAPDSTLTVFFNLGRIASFLPLQAESVGKIILGSSANITGMGNIYESEKLPKNFIESCDLIIGNGKSKYGHLRLKTVIVDISSGEITRAGPFQQEIQELIKHTNKII